MLKGTFCNVKRVSEEAAPAFLPRTGVSDEIPAADPQK
jgi:hypothetical protein